MAVDFPSSPTPGQVYTQAGATWTWDGVKWVAQGTGTGIYLPLAGGVMTGDITLKGDPSAPLHPVTYRMVSNPNDNRIINGDMRIDQRNSGASGTAANYTVDRWQYIATQASKITWGRNYGGGAVVNTGFLYYLGVQSSSAYALAAGDTFWLQQPIEADAIGDSAFGQSNAQPLTLSFWAYSSLTGIFSGSLANYPSPPTRSFPFTFSLPTASTWTKIVITIPGDTAGAWILSGNAAWGVVRFDLGSGATYRAPAGAWASGNFTGANGSVNVVSTNAAGFFLTGVKLEIGSVATPFNRQSLAKSLADCQRYYQALGSGTCIGIQGYGASACACTISYPTTMRATPTAAMVGNWSIVSAGAINLYPGLSTLLFQTNPPALGNFSVYPNDGTGSITLIAEL